MTRTRETILTAELDSSAIDRATYERDSYTLTITFHTGREYAYHDVPESVFRGLVRSKSAGRYFQKRIRPHFSLA